MAPSLLLLALTTALVTSTEALNFLLLPMMSASHILRLGWVGRGLLARGHTVYMIRHHSIPIPTQLHNTDIKFIQYSTGEPVHFISTPACSQIFTSIESDPGKAVPELLSFFDRQCDDLLDNEELYEKLEKLNLDFALVDAFSSLQCFMAYPRRLGIPYAGLGLLPPLDSFSTTMNFNYITPTLPIAMAKYPETPSLIHRTKQWLVINIMSMIVEYRQNNEKLGSFLKKRPLKSFSELRDSASLWLVDSHPIVDVAKPTVPKVVYVGGLTTGKAEKLPENLQKFADEATEGLIVVSFGTVVTHLPRDEFDTILTALNNVTDRVVLATPVKLSKKLRKHILVQKWIPQSDLLAHPNTKLFITHCGASSQHQSIFHGVPMLGIPFQEEQKANAQRMQTKNFGRLIDRTNLSPQIIIQEINTLKKDKAISETVKMASKMMRDRLLEPETEAAFWLEHVAKFGSRHLDSYTERLTWYEVLMLDMLSLVFLVISLPVLSLIPLCKLINLKRTSKTKRD